MRPPIPAHIPTAQGLSVSDGGYTQNRIPIIIGKLSCDDVAVMTTVEGKFYADFRVPRSARDKDGKELLTYLLDERALATFGPAIFAGPGDYTITDALVAYAEGDLAEALIRNGYHRQPNWGRGL